MSMARWLIHVACSSWTTQGAEFQGIKLPLLGEFLEWFEGMLALPGNSEYELMLDTKNVRPLIVPQVRVGRVCMMRVNQCEAPMKVKL